MREGGYDQKVNETVTVVTAKTNELGQKTWGIMKGVMAMASQKVEEYTKEGMNWKGDDWNSSDAKNGYYQEFGNENREWNGKSSSVTQTSAKAKDSFGSSSSWDDWDQTDKTVDSSKNTQNAGNSWAGWDDDKDDEDDTFHQRDYNKSSSAQNGKSGSFWTEGGFR